VAELEAALTAGDRKVLVLRSRCVPLPRWLVGLFGTALGFLLLLLPVWLEGWISMGARSALNFVLAVGLPVVLQRLLAMCLYPQQAELVVTPDGLEIPGFLLGRGTTWTAWWFIGPRTSCR
jgi:hypothetical protein